jgi:hypothetical protein
MQGTRMSFKSKEDAIHFAEKQGQFSSFSCKPMLMRLNLTTRLGLLLATHHSEEDPAQELLGELSLPAKQASHSPHEIDIYIFVPVVCEVITHCALQLAWITPNMMQV